MVLNHVVLESSSLPNPLRKAGRGEAGSTCPLLLDMGTSFLVSQHDSLVLLSEKTLRAMSGACTKDTH